MIELKEMRLGSLLLSPVGITPQKVTALSGNSVRLSGGNIFSPEALSPVPLTHALLLQLGFEKDTTGYRSKRFSINQHEASFYFRLPQGTGYGQPVHWLHQLQNLSLVLTGQDLELSGITTSFKPGS